jgi:hypothetical protein
VVRDPVDRFLSGFVMLCHLKHVCYGCSTELHCFIEALFKEFQHFASTNSLTSYPKWHNVLHFYPQFWHCDFVNRITDFTNIFVFDYSEEFREVMRRSFVSVGFNRSIVYSSWGVNGDEAFLASESQHTGKAGSKDALLQILQSDVTLADMLIRAYLVLTSELRRSRIQHFGNG